MLEAGKCAVSQCAAQLEAAAVADLVLVEDEDKQVGQQRPSAKAGREHANTDIAECVTGHVDLVDVLQRATSVAHHEQVRGHEVFVGEVPALQRRQGGGRQLLVRQLCAGALVAKLRSIAFR